jgi:hypothetical protein
MTNDDNDALALARKMLHPPEDECCGGHIKPTDALLLAAEVVAQDERIAELEAELGATKKDQE